MSEAIANDHVVTIHYKLTDDEGTLLDSSEGAEPLDYLHGAGNIVPGLEQALAGKAKGDAFSVRVEAAEAYGEVMAELIQNVDRALFADLDDLQVGMELAAEGPDGQVQRIVVREVEESEVKIDANHPLAGVSLNFDIEVVEVRQATETELEHGHVH
jgi:FKBP-type peptidyl-prolyl cis-trans isomerase SlyD